jgi:putative flippase GtrA
MDKPDTVTDNSPATTMPWNHPLMQPLRFLFSGGLATLAHWLVMALLIMAGSDAAVATGVGAIVGALVNYILQRNVTFRSSVAHRRAMQAYLLACVIIWCANLAVFIILHSGLGLTPLYAQGLTTAIVACLSYVLYKRMVFHER